MKNDKVQEGLKIAQMLKVRYVLLDWREKDTRQYLKSGLQLFRSYFGMTTTTSLKLATLDQPVRAKAQGFSTRGG